MVVVGEVVVVVGGNMVLYNCASQQSFSLWSSCFQCFLCLSGMCGALRDSGLLLVLVLVTYSSFSPSLLLPSPPPSPLPPSLPPLLAWARCTLTGTSQPSQPQSHPSAA